MKIMTVVGARPQFIKAAAITRSLRGVAAEVLVHTGQHYDRDMSEVFFEELSIPRPDYNLGVGSATHGRQTGEMLEKLEEVMLKERPDAAVVFGDTNSTLAGALAAAKLHIPVVHVEAGLRSFDKAMPEELNRVLSDHVSTLLFCPTRAAVENLAREGITGGVFDVGDVMYDALLFYRSLSDKRYAGRALSSLDYALEKPGDISGRYYLATVHRAENTDGTGALSEILAALESLDAPAIFPLHPRTLPLVKALTTTKKFHNIHFVRPVGYLLMLYLTSHAAKIVTDSGGLQKEAYLSGVPCVTVRGRTEWTETLQCGFNILAKPCAEDIISKLRAPSPDPKKRADCYGDGHAAERICAIMKDALK